MIIGGGVIGSAIAAFLTEGGASVSVIERDPTYRQASSSLSGSSIRQQFSTKVNIALSQFGVEYLRGTELGLREPGYLYLAGVSGAEILQENHVVQQAEGADIALLSPASLGERFPWLTLDGLALGALGLSGEGWFDGPGLMQRFRAQARSRGATYRHDEAIGMEWTAGRIAAVLLKGGDRVPADFVVNAAGPHARHVAAMARINLPVEARKRCVFVFQCKQSLPNCPLVIDPSGVWWRPEGDRYLAGWSPSDDLEALGLEVEHAHCDDIVWPALAARVQAFEAVRVTSAWAGHYDYNTFDQNGLLGILADAPNLVFANGFSGNGMQQSPGVGRGIAELILHGGYRTLDLSELDVGRLAAGKRVLERNII